MYQHYSLHKVILRRVAAVIIGLLALPVMLFREDRARFYSYLHRFWSKTSTKPVWLAQAEAAGCDFY
ncbi:YbfA family protein [Winslowiella iniecta]|uniref:Membrane protein n=1 Tax=Winslowiella iniecta TaxID=1560201 RepID=A0A0L7TDM4_9GAMM|nr:YbfA family protein [Winslowiella iniecta]KOC89454.1 membrane protein [Winslowiella iniecta]KOC93469.1 membrane protein [Winslowiella iniecta]